MKKYILVIAIIYILLAVLTISSCGTTESEDVDSLSLEAARKRCKPDTVYIPQKKDTVFVPQKKDTVYVPGKNDTIYIPAKPDTVKIPIPYPVYKDTCLEDDTVIIPPVDTPKFKVQYGILQAQDNISETKAILDNSAVDMVRVPVYFSKTTNSRVADEYLKQGYKVQLNFNWKGTGTAVEFPTDNAVITSKAEAFFQYYLKYRALIPVVVVENEWDNMSALHGPGAYHTGTVKEYLNELRIVTEIGHKYGFKIADAGLTGNNLQRWTISNFSEANDTAKFWKANYFIGYQANYELMVSAVNEYAAGVRSIPVDYINTHWYNKDNCPGGYPIAIHKYLQACGKTKFINNEWGIKTKNLDLFLQTVEEIRKAGAEIAVIYSGVDAPDNAIKVTDEMYQQLK